MQDSQVKNSILEQVRLQALWANEVTNNVVKQLESLELDEEHLPQAELQLLRFLLDMAQEQATKVKTHVSLRT